MYYDKRGKKVDGFVTESFTASSQSSDCFVLVLSLNKIVMLFVMKLSALLLGCGSSPQFTTGIHRDSQPSPGLTGNHIHLNGETGPCSTLYVKGSTKRPN